MTYQEVKEYIERYDCKLLSTEYKSTTDMLEIQCICGEVFNRSFSNFKKNRTRCKKCSGKYSPTYEEVKNNIEERGCKLLSNEYINCKAKLKIQCSCGEIFEMNYENFLTRGIKQCKKCNGRQRYSYEEVKEEIESYGCKLLSEEYVNTVTKLEIQCSCGEIFYADLHSFKGRDKKQCDKCGLKKRSKENHYCYNPNLTEEERQDNIDTNERREWRKKVYERDNYICQCCGKQGRRLNAHHLNGYNWDKDNRYNVDNGVTLCEECHGKFHQIYGYGNNTSEQYQKYIKLK